MNTVLVFSYEFGLLLGSQVTHDTILSSFASVIKKSRIYEKGEYAVVLQKFVILLVAEASVKAGKVSCANPFLQCMSQEKRSKT